MLNTWVDYPSFEEEVNAVKMATCLVPEKGREKGWTAGTGGEGMGVPG